MAIYYPGLRGADFKDVRPFVCERLVALRSALRTKLPPKTLDKNLLVATWNLRDFGKKPGHGFNPENRFPESFYYIAEIIDRFDVIALQEINENLVDFERMRRILGRQYDYIATDVTEGVSGNGERMVFVYDTRKVAFRNIAGEIVLPPGKGTTEQFARTPFVVSFQCGWLKFDLCTAHLYYGEDTGEKKKRRVREIANLAKFMMARAKKNATNTFILGDFNVVGPEDETWKALEDSGFQMPEALRTVKTNIDEEKFYDRIAFASARDGEVTFSAEKPGGSFRFFDTVFRTEDFEHYLGLAKNMGDNYRRWSTWQMSDHLPLWVHMETDFADQYLNQLS